MPKWTPDELLEIARRRRVLGGAIPLSDEQIMQICDPGQEKVRLTDMAKLPSGHDADDALRASVLLGSTENSRTFLQKGANPGLTDNDGRTAADWAKAEGHAEVERLLAEKKA